MTEYPKMVYINGALSNASSDYRIVQDAEEEENAEVEGFTAYLGDPAKEVEPPTPKRKK